MKLSIKMPFRLAVALWRAAIWRLSGRPALAPEPVRASRLAACNNCPNLSDGQCGKCLCFVDAKVFLYTESCPEHRWPPSPR